ncbi:peptide deformylase [Buchnera aphidicola]|uniref:Peptide deformylase n=1 Tax=Buchnera aphidicola (Sarucallis kahawaluokalani) TaxID=1241878 RepID=A0A4D6Y8V7_9GAMM|nr:peptide deformylase [Buchnera aphidicola]QCI26107.1 peptide deformylase [Buchnera aphidicola (Sarucallis kahawaluokalani)]
MVILKILKYPDKRLRLIAKPVKIINQKIKNIIHNMFETMYHNHGIGLAATQVNIHLNIIVIDLMHQKYPPITLINPKKIYAKGKILTEEGCLSVPETNQKVTRFKKIKIQAINYHGKNIVIKAHSLLSICIQHEMDHLNGKLFIDYTK